jgi:hypothetical protein
MLSVLQFFVNIKFYYTIIIMKIININIPPCEVLYLGIESCHERKTIILHMRCVQNLTDEIKGNRIFLFK